jgi:hypothetical protein
MVDMPVDIKLAYIGAFSAKTQKTDHNMSLGEDDSWEKPEAKRSRDTVPLSALS